MSAIDLAQLSPPDVVESLDYEQILASLKASLVQLMPEQDRSEVANTLTLESEPLTKLLELTAYRELLLRQRINDAARAVMLAYATGRDLDQIGANFAVPRLVIYPGDALATPPVPVTLESDSAYRKRIQMSFEGFTTAGSSGSYLFHGLSADPDVKDILALSESPGTVQIYVLSRIGNGAASEPLLASVESALNAENVRPLTDQVTVQSSDIESYMITATLFIREGPDSAVVRDRAIAAAQAMTQAQHRIGASVRLSAVYAALQQPGVEYVSLVQPDADVIPPPTSAPFCTGFMITMEPTE